MLDPTTKEDAVYFGDSSGGIYKFDGTSDTDGGTDTLTCSRTTGIIRGLPAGTTFDIDGWIAYKKQFKATVTITFLFAGEAIFDKTITLTIPGEDNIAVYDGEGSNAAYYGGSYYYGGTFSERVHRQKFSPPGLNSWFQVKIDVTSTGAADIEEIGFRFRSA